MAEEEHELDFELTIDTPYLVLTGELWDVCYEIWKNNDRVMLQHCISHAKMAQVVEILRH